MTKSTRKPSEKPMPKVIKTEPDHQRALARVDELFAAKPGTSEGDELELWLLLIEKYKQTFQLICPIHRAIASHGSSQSDAEDLIPLSK